MDNEKHIDESWKDDVAREKGLSDGGSGTADTCGEGCSHDHGHDGQGEKDDQRELEVNFLNYIMSLGYQAMIFLGEVPNPMTGKSEKNFRQAKFLIDTLALVQEKTKGNLTPEEDNLLSASLYELRMKFVESAKKEQ